MAYDPRKDNTLPESVEAPRVYDVLDDPEATVSVWAGEGQMVSVRINGAAATEANGLWTARLGKGSALKGGTLSIDSAVLHTNPLTKDGVLSVVVHQVLDIGAVVNKKKWCQRWIFTSNEQLLNITVYVQ